MVQDPYKVLGLAPDASDEEIKKAFETVIRVLGENGAPLRQ